MEEVKLNDLRTKIVQFFREFSGSAALRNQLFQSKTVEELVSKIDNFVKQDG
jgi:hypothetical protein